MKLYTIDEYGVKNYSPLFPMVIATGFLASLIVVSSLLLLKFDGQSYADSLWLAFMGSSTVGFGAVTPQTGNGRMIIALTSSIGICTFNAIGTFSAMWAFGFFDTESKNRELKAQNAEIIRTNILSNKQNAEIINTNLIAIAGNNAIEKKLNTVMHAVFGTKV